MARMGMQSPERQAGPVATRSVESPGMEPEMSSRARQVLAWSVAVTGAIVSFSYVSSVAGITFVLVIIGGWDNLLWVVGVVLVPPAAALWVYRTLRRRGTQPMALRVGAALWMLAFAATLGFALYEVAAYWALNS